MSSIVSRPMSRPMSRLSRPMSRLSRPVSVLSPPLREYFSKIIDFFKNRSRLRSGDDRVLTNALLGSTLSF